MSEVRPYLIRIGTKQALARADPSSILAENILGQKLGVHTHTYSKQQRFLAPEAKTIFLSSQYEMVQTLGQLQLSLGMTLPPSC